MLVVLIHKTMIKKQEINEIGQDWYCVGKYGFKTYYVDRSGRCYSEGSNNIKEVGVEGGILKVRGDDGWVDIDIAREVAVGFLEFPWEMVDVVRIDGNVGNCDVRNLKWRYIGMQKKFNGSRSCKLNEEKVKEVRKMANEGKSLKNIAETFSISYQTVRKVLLGYSWAWVK